MISYVLSGGITSVAVKIGTTAPPPPPPPVPGGALTIAGTYTMTAATNDPPNNAFARAPNFGKHQSWAYSPVEKAAYIFGGDGGSDSRSSTSSHGWHFGRLHLDSTPPRFDYFYPYRGIAGQICPAGADCVPFVYDSKRNCFWQIGGYQWGVTTDENWVGTPKALGVWRLDPVAGGFGTWTQVSATDVPNSKDEGMSGFYYPRLDMIIGLYDNRAWWYKCADDTRGLAVVPMTDGRDVGRYCAPGYDATKDELLFVTPINGKVVAAKLTNFPTVTTREIATVGTPGSRLNPSWSQIGQFPSIFVPSQRSFVLFYIDRIKVVNVDTGVVTDGPAYRSPGSYINSAAYAPDLDAIVGTYKDTSDVVVLKWVGGTPPVDPPVDPLPPPVAAWLPASGKAAGVGVNLLKAIDPDPSNAQPYRGGGNFGAITDAWGGSVYAPELGALGSILLWNGGDGDYWGNAVCRFDFETLTWTRLTEPCTALRAIDANYMADPNYDGGKGLHAIGQPSVPHNYDTVQWIPPSTAHPKGVFACAVRLYCYGPRTPINSAYFDLATKTWSVADAAVQRQISGPNTATSIYDSKRNRIWYKGDGNSDRLGYVDLATLNHGAVGIPNSLLPGNATSAYDAKRDRWLTLGMYNDNLPVGLFAIDLANLGAGSKQIALTGAPLLKWGCGFDWCPDLDCGFGYLNGDPQAVYKFHPDSWLVERIVIGGAAITGTSQQSFSKWRWASKLKAFYLLTGIGSPVWVYKP